MRIILVGFMGSGKTTIGKILAQNLNIKHIDMDEAIEKEENYTIAKLFENKGEEYFRKVENEMLKKVIKESNVIISTGGGIITKKENCEILKKEKNVFFLDATVETIIKNVSKEIEKRPLLKESSNIYETINALFKVRYEKYLEVSKKIIDVNCKNIDEVVSQILVYIE